MKWNKVTIDTTTAAVDRISYALEELGIEGIEVVDHVPLSEEDRKIMYVDLLPDEIAPDDGTAKLHFYVDEKEDLGRLVSMVEKELTKIGQFLPIGSGKISLDTTKEEDWVNNWKQFFKPFRLDGNIVIKPSWEDLKEQKEGDIVIQIDPGTAFGTGSHETTKLCISQLKKYIRPHQSVLDVGCGSGILSIIARKLGAKKAVGCDIDPNAVRAALENSRMNGIPKEEFQVLQGNLLEDGEFCACLGRGCYDIVVANILADVIIPLSKIAGGFLKKDGIFIASGIIDTKEEEVKRAFLENGFRILDVDRMGDWVSITGTMGK